MDPRLEAGVREGCVANMMILDLKPVADTGAGLRVITQFDLQLSDDVSLRGATSGGAGRRSHCVCGTGGKPQDSNLFARVGGRDYRSSIESIPGGDYSQ